VFASTKPESRWSVAPQVRIRARATHAETFTRDMFVFRTRSYREALNRRTRMRSAFCLEPFLNSPPRGDEINEKQR
jgi:hypothetical protein